MSMFWGLSMKPNRKYTQTIVKSFHISGAAVDEGETAKIYITADKTKFIVATLTKSLPQVSLDLNFCKGDKIMFQTTGDANVSLIGYLHDADESDDEDYENSAEYEAIAKSLAKHQEGATDENDDESEEDSDEEGGMSNLLEGDSGEEEQSDESGDEEEDEEDDDDDDDDEEEEDESEDETPKAKKAKLTANANAKNQNGVAKNEKKPEQQQPKSKKEKKAAAAEEKKEQPKAKEAKPTGGERVIAGGVRVQDLTVGNGPEAKQGKRVGVYYIGRLKSNNKTFDSMQKGAGFKFGLGAGEVIKGWDIGVVGMKIGGKRRITCPPHMAYGARGSPPTIPPNSTLVFDVELKAVN
ncbi:FK506-bp1 [Drosophila busckii]|uniref:peptidylprolyl isomerase n=1 Tax=Drosophila busckii TaxID=30019 RepID=A0A0M3QYK7_DROBS|nr:39 kDa FK506-binding nuclear protein [Drosophila busckii]ALC47789.1 FK506-bp1 [Drosophila busckii]